MTQTKTERTAEASVSRPSLPRHFMNKENRDTAFYGEYTKEERKMIRRRSGGPHQIHPRYVEDYEEETGNTLSREDKGFGNTIYKTWFDRLYDIQVKPEYWGNPDAPD